MLRIAGQTAETNWADMSCEQSWVTRGVLKKNGFYLQRWALQLVSFIRQNCCTVAQLFYGSSSPGKTHSSDKKVYYDMFRKCTKK